MVWWNTDYPFRRKLRVIAPPSGVLQGYPANYFLDTSITVDLNKMQSDFSDLAVVYNTTMLGRVVQPLIHGEKLEFPIQAALTSNQVVDDAYYIYYGSSHPLAQPAYSANPIPDSVAIDGPGVSYTRPGEDWVDGVAVKPLSRATFVFGGDTVELNYNKSHNQGIAEIQIDDDSWTEIDMYSKNITSGSYIVSMETSGSHIVRIRVSGKRNPSSSGVGINITGFGYRKHVTVEDRGEEINAELVWSST